MVSFDLPTDSFVLHSVVLKLLRHFGDVFSEDRLEFSDTLSPNGFYIDDSGDSLDSDVLWKLDQESPVERIFRIDDVSVVAFGILRLDPQISVTGYVILVIVLSTPKVLKLIFQTVV